MKSECDGITFRPAKGGVISETTMKTARGGRGGGPLHDYKSETAIHPTVEHAAAHLKKHLGHAFKSEEKSEGEEG